MQDVRHRFFLSVTDVVAGNMPIYVQRSQKKNREIHQSSVRKNIEKIPRLVAEKKKNLSNDR